MDEHAFEIWHNPRCSKSRQTLALLEERGIHPQVVEYLKRPPSARRLDQVLKMLGREPRELMRTKEKVYAELGLAGVRARKALIAAMVAHPALIERPVVIVADRAAVGRPPEAVLELIGG